MPSMNESLEQIRELLRISERPSDAHNSSIFYSNINAVTYKFLVIYVHVVIHTTEISGQEDEFTFKFSQSDVYYIKKFVVVSNILKAKSEFSTLRKFERKFVTKIVSDLTIGLTRTKCWDLRCFEWRPVPILLVLKPLK